MKRFIPYFALLLSLTPSVNAGEFPCEGAVSSQTFRDASMKIVQAVAGACSKDFSQRACMSFLMSMAKDGGAFEKVNGKAIADYDEWIKGQCPKEIAEQEAQK